MADESSQPKNRKERRAAAKSSGKPVSPATTTPSIKMAQPDRSGPKGKTLLDLYDERKPLLQSGQPFSPKHADGAVRDESGNILNAGITEDEDPVGPVGAAFFWAVCLCMLHFTLDTLTYQQYRQEILWSPIFKRSATVLPILWLFVYLARTERFLAWRKVRQLLFFAGAVVTGCYTIYVGNEGGYFAVMKRAPPLGTLWVWSVVEMDLLCGVASLAVNVGYLFWQGYTIF